MHGQVKKKPEQHFEEPKFHDKLLEEKKQPQVSSPIVLPSMSEGPMLLAAEQGKKIDQNARIQYEKSLRLEIEALKGKKKIKRRLQKTIIKKKQSDEPPPKK